MGGGRKRKSTGKVVLGSPNRPAMLTPTAGTSVDANSATAAAQLDCQTFDLERTGVAARKVRVGMTVYGRITGRNVEVLHKELGFLGLAPSRTAGTIVKAGRDREWAGEVLVSNSDKLSVKVMLCPS